MALRDLTAYLEDDVLEVPVGAKRYRIPSPDAKTGLWLSALANLGVKASAGGELTDADVARLQLDDDEEREFMQRVLGAAFDELVADGVSWVRIQRLGRYAFLYFALSPEQADQALASGALSGEAAAPNRAARRARKGTATSTRSRGSTAGTTKTRPRAKA